MQQRDIENVIKQYSDMLYRLALIRIGNREDAEDIVQQTFLKLVEHYDCLESPEHVKAWLLRVCCNQCNNHFKLPWNRKRVEMDNFTDYIASHNLCEDTCEQETIHKFQQQELLRKVYQLPEKYRIVFHLCYMEEYTPPEIAKILGLSTNTVNVRLHRAKNKLAQSLNKEDFFNEK